VKGWLHVHCPTVAYTTAMAWKKLASRLKTLCSVPAEIPFEWLLPDAPEIAILTQNPETAAAIAEGRKRLAGFLEEGKSFVGLQKLAERKMNIVRLPSKNIENSLILSSNGMRFGERRKVGAGKGGARWGNGRKQLGEGQIRARNGVTTGGRKALRRARRAEMRARRRAEAMPGQLAALADVLRQSENDPRNFSVFRQLLHLLR
jgi:hypothetical protein